MLGWIAWDFIYVNWLLFDWLTSHFLPHISDPWLSDWIRISESHITQTKQSGEGSHLQIKMLFTYIHYLLRIHIHTFKYGYLTCRKIHNPWIWAHNESHDIITCCYLQGLSCACMCLCINVPKHNKIAAGNLTRMQAQYLLTLLQNQIKFINPIISKTRL